MLEITADIDLSKSRYYQNSRIKLKLYIIRILQ